MRNAFRSLPALFAAAGLSACGTTASAPSATTGTTAAQPAPQITLQQAQTAATILYTNLKAQVAAYEQNVTLDAQTQADLDQSVKDLGVLVANFTALPPGANWVNDVEALLNVGQAVVNNLPAGVMSPSTKAAIDGSLSLLQSALVLLPAIAQPPTAQATGPL